jgi:hypothetical protein
VAPRYQRKIGWIFWGSISGKYSRHKELFWEKDWEAINEGPYCGVIIPIADEICNNIQSCSSNKTMPKGMLLPLQILSLKLQS